MSSDIDRLVTLESKLKKSLNKANRGLVVTAVVFIIVIAFEIFYTTYVYNSVKTLATPDNIAAYISGNIQEKLPEITAKINENPQKYADIMATETFNYAKSLLPLATDFTKEQLYSAANSINADLNSSYLPALNKYFADNKQEILQSFATFSDEEIAGQVTKAMLSSVNVELANMQLPFANAVSQLRSKMDRLAYMPDSELTKQELAEKKAIAYWVYLAKHSQYSKAPPLKYQSSFLSDYN